MYMDYNNFDINELRIFPKIVGTREKICIAHGPTMRSLTFLTPAGITNYPRITGNGDFGGQYGPQDPKKARFCLDLNQWPPGTAPDPNMTEQMKTFFGVIRAVDNALLEFMFNNQLKWLQRKNLSKDEVRMLQIPSVKTPIDKDTGAEKEECLRLTAPKYYYDQVGNERERSIGVCDHTGKIIADGCVMPGDMVCATMHLGSVYNGVGGDKFGVSWQLEDTQVVCQAQHLKPKECIPAFQTVAHNMSHEFTWSGATEFGASL